MSADTCTVREGENTGNMNQVGAHAHRRGFGLMRRGELWKHCPCSALKHRYPLVAPTAAGRVSGSREGSLPRCSLSLPGNIYTDSSWVFDHAAEIYLVIHAS